MTSIIICSVDDAKFSAVSEMYARLFGADGCQIIRIPDARSIAEGYNRGLRQCQGQHVIFSHDDIEILSPDLPAIVASRLAEFDVVGIAGTTRLVDPVWFRAGPPFIFGQVAHNRGPGVYMVDLFGAGSRVAKGIQAMDGIFLAARVDVARQIGFDQDRFDGFHLYDLDFTYRAHLAGFRLAVCCDIFVLHQSIGVYDEVWRHYAARFLQKHAGRLAPLAPHPFQWSAVQLAEKQMIVEHMTCPSWD
jgi:GT2 family glycosyltransferase